MPAVTQNYQISVHPVKDADIKTAFDAADNVSARAKELIRKGLKAEAREKSPDPVADISFDMVSQLRQQGQAAKNGALNAPTAPELAYEPIDESTLTPSQLIAKRKADAKARYKKPDPKPKGA